MLALTDTLEPVANTIVWLTKERREWLSGPYVSVQWDMLELEKKAKEIIGKNLLKVRMLADRIRTVTLGSNFTVQIFCQVRFCQCKISGLELVFSVF
jgi:hypothetical protein